MAHDAAVSAVLHLDHCCIRTAAERRYRRIVDRLMNTASSHGSGLASEAEFLHDFITNTDFQALRSSRPELDGRANVVVRVHRERDGFVVGAPESPCFHRTGA